MLPQKHAHMVAPLSMFNKHRRIIGFTLWLACGCISSAFASTENTASKVTFVPLQHTEWLEQLGTYKPNIVVVDMWATWCASCLEEFPKIVDLHKKYKDAGVQFVSMNLDDHNDQPSLENAEKFLQKMNAEFDNFWMNENLMIAFEKLNLIGIPAVIIYDRNGDERYRLTGDDPNNQYSGKDIEKAIKELLAH